MNSIIILGAGNISYHLINILSKISIVKILQIYNRHLDPAKKIGEKYNIEYTDKILNLKKSDIYIIATTDRSIINLSKKIKFDNCLVLHTSGANEISILKGKYRKGVIYLFSTFSKNITIEDYKNIPLFIETEKKKDFHKLKKIFSNTFIHIYTLKFQDRIKLHLCGVFVNNFTNHMIYIAYKIFKDNNIDNIYLKEIINQTYSNIIINNNPMLLQTGPAIRNDSTTIRKHEKTLKVIDKDILKIYKLITKNIIKTYVKKYK